MLSASQSTPHHSLPCVRWRAIRDRIQCGQVKLHATKPQSPPHSPTSTILQPTNQPTTQNMFVCHVMLANSTTTGICTRFTVRVSHNISTVWYKPPPSPATVATLARAMHNGWRCVCGWLAVKNPNNRACVPCTQTHTPNAKPTNPMRCRLPVCCQVRDSLRRYSVHARNAKCARARFARLCTRARKTF